MAIEQKREAWNGCRGGKRWLRRVVAHRELALIQMRKGAQVRIVLDLAQVPLQVIRHADRAALARRQQLLHRVPRLPPLFSGRQHSERGERMRDEQGQIQARGCLPAPARRVYKVGVQVVEPELCARLGTRRQCRIVSHVVGLDLGHHKQLLARNAAASDGVPDLPLVAVHAGRVHEPIAHAQRGGDDLLAQRAAQEHRPTADGRHHRPRAQPEPSIRAQLRHPLSLSA